jgi:hypothetical protein
VPPSQRVAPGPSSLLESIDGLRASFDAAAARAGLVERDLLVADRRIRLRFAEPALVPTIEPAFEHLVTPLDHRDDPSLTVCVWDAGSTGVPRVPLPADMLHHGESGPRYHGEHDGIVVHAADATISVIDKTQRAALYYVPDADVVPWYQKAAPLKDVVHAWAGWHDLEFLHAAAVGHPDGGVLIAGAAGSGKSTTSLACLRAGHAYAGDDYVLVDVQRAFVHPLYSSAKLEWEALDRHSGLLQPANSRPDPKAVAFLAGDAPDRIGAGFPLLAMLLPTITDRDETRAVATTAARALLGLAPSTVLQMPGQSQPALGAMARLVERIPALRLELGTNVSAVPDAVDAVIAGLRDR